MPVVAMSDFIWEDHGNGGKKETTSSFFFGCFTCGIKPVPQHWKFSLNHWTTKEVPDIKSSEQCL